MIQMTYANHENKFRTKNIGSTVITFTCYEPITSLKLSTCLKHF